MAQLAAGHDIEAEIDDDVRIDKDTNDLKENIQYPTTTTALTSEQIEELDPELHITTWMVVLAINILGAAILMEVVGAGAFAMNIVATVGNADRSSWFTTICFAGTCLLGPMCAQGADLFGRRYFVLFGCMCGVVGNIVISRATTFEAAVVGFCLLGPACGLQGLTYAIVSEVLPRKWRGWASASLGASSGIMAIVAVLAGSKMTSRSAEGWRDYFYLMAGMFGVMGIILAFAYRPPARLVQVQYGKGERLRSMDWIGFALLTAALIPLLVGVSFGNNPYPWSSVIVLAPLVVGLVFSGAFVLWEWKGTSTGVVAHVLFGDRNLAIQLLGTALEGAAFAGLNSYYIYQIIVFFHLSGIVAGGRFAIFFGCTVLCAFIFAPIITRTKRVRPVLLVGVLMSLAGTVGLYFVTPDKQGDRLSYIVALLGGSASCLISQNVAAQMSAPPEFMGAVSAIMLSARSLGGALATAIYTSVFHQRLARQIAALVPQALLQAGLDPQYIGDFIAALTGQNQAALTQIPGISPQIIGAGGAALLQSFKAAFQRVWLISAIIWAIVFVISVFTIDPKSKFTGLVDAPVEEHLVYRSAYHGKLDQKHAEEMLEHTVFESHGNNIQLRQLSRHIKV